MRSSIHTIVIALLVVSPALATPPEYQAADAGTVFLSPVVDQDWGRPLAAGDLDGDGYDEVIVAASESWGSVISHVYIIRGGPGTHGQGLVDLTLGGVDQVVIGAQLDDNLGSSITTGDVNGDTIDDLLICASLADYSSRADAGIAYLIYGGAGFFDSPTRDLSTTSEWDVRIIGPVAAGDMGACLSFGGGDTHAAAIGNLSGDVYGDIVLGVHLADGNTDDTGRVYIVLGQSFATGTTLDLASSANYDVAIYGDDRYDETGDFVLTGDVTGDGLDDVIIPNHYFSQYLFDSEGAVHIFRGRTTWTTSYYNLGTTPADITLLGYRKYDDLGESAAVGDFNHDGIMDLATGAPGADAGVFDDQIGDGFVYGLLGSTSYQTGTHLIDYATATPDFLFIGEYQEGLGAETSAGDFNGDGYDDVAASERFGGPSSNGVVEVLWGRDFSPGATFTANVDSDLRIIGGAQDRIGFSLSASDTNNDGLDEILFGSPFSRSATATTARSSSSRT